MELIAFDHRSSCKVESKRVGEGTKNMLGTVKRV